MSLLSCVSHHSLSIVISGKVSWSLESKSHEMICHVFVSMTLPSVGIATLSEWNYRPSTKPCNISQMTLDELYNKSHECNTLGVWLP
jgi:hypothetical protein